MNFKMIFKFGIFVSFFSLVFPIEGSSPSVHLGETYTLRVFKRIVPDLSDWEKVEPILKEIQSSKEITEHAVVTYVKAMSELTGKTLPDKSVQRVSSMLELLFENSTTTHPYDRKFLLRKTIPLLASLALHLPKLFPQGIDVLHENSKKQISLTKLHVAALIAGGVLRVVNKNGPLDVYYESNNKMYKLDGFTPSDLQKTLAEESLRPSEIESIHGRLENLKIALSGMQFQDYNYYVGYFKDVSKVMSIMAYTNTITDLFLPFFKHNATLGYDAFVDYDNLQYPVKYFEKYSPLERIDFVLNKTDGEWTQEYMWKGSDAPLRRVSLLKNSRIEDIPEAIHVNFSDANIGGGIFRYSVYQAEAYMTTHPEALVSVLFAPRMEHNDAIVIVGAELFAYSSGHGGRFRYESCAAASWGEDASYPNSHMNIAKQGSDNYHMPIKNRVTLDDFQRRRVVLSAIDAINYKEEGAEDQFSSKAIWRETLKAYSGFSSYPDEPTCSKWPIATGNWGCGHLGGNVQLKFLIQWMAASAAGREMKYCSFKAPGLNNLEHISRELTRKYKTVGGLFTSLLTLVEENKNKGETRENIDMFDELLS